MIDVPYAKDQMTLERRLFLLLFILTFTIIIVATSYLLFTTCESFVIITIVTAITSYYLLRTTYYSLFTTYYLRFTIHYLLSAIYYYYYYCCFYCSYHYHYYYYLQTVFVTVHVSYWDFNRIWPNIGLSWSNSLGLCWSSRYEALPSIKIPCSWRPQKCARVSSLYSSPQERDSVGRGHVYPGACAHMSMSCSHYSQQ